MSDVKKMKCENCLFYDKDYESDLYDGGCKRYPPKPIFASDNIVSYFPGVDKDQECGEHVYLEETILNEDEIIPISEEQGYYIACCGCDHFDIKTGYCESYRVTYRCPYIKDIMNTLKQKGYIK